MSKSVLLVDDDVHIQKLVSFFLEKSGYKVRVCGDGFTAIEELATHHYDLVILDIMMPHMGGFRTLQTIRIDPTTKNLPVIMLTGSHERSDVLKAVKNGVTDYVIKPPIRELLVERIDRILADAAKVKAA